MALPTKHIRSQGPVLAMLGSTAVTALRRAVTGKVPSGVGPLPGPEIHATLPPRPRDLIRDYVRFCGGEPNSYKHTVPPHLWPQWGFPLAGRAISTVPYPLHKILNGGCRVEVNAVIANDEPLEVSARLLSIDENERRAVLESEVVTGTAANPRAIVATMYAIVPLGRRAGDGKDKPASKKSEPERVPLDAEELARWKIPSDAGLAFALLTGDFNPVHWIPTYARAFGFRNTILHGFGSMAKAWEGLVRSRYGGSVNSIREFDVKFTKPLVLPAKIGLYLQETDPQPVDREASPHAGRRPSTGDVHGREDPPSVDRFWLAVAPGASPYLSGTVRA